MKSKLKVYLIIFASVCAGIYLLYTGAIDIFNSVRMFSNSIQIEGIVKEVQRKRSGGDSARFYAVVEYKGQNGNTYQFKNRRPYGYIFSLNKGEIIKVRYLKSDPNVSVIDTFWQKFIGPVLSLGVGILFLWFAKNEFRKPFIHNNSRL